jgi:hypothetical protein
MIRIAITPAAYDAIRSTLPQDAPLWPAERQGEHNVSSMSRRPSSTIWRPCGGEERATTRQPQHDFEAHGVTEPSLPKEFEVVRSAARRAINPIKPADASTQTPNADFLFDAQRSDAGRSFAPLLSCLFSSCGASGLQKPRAIWESEWSIPIDLDGVAYIIEHRKMGVGVFVQNKEKDEAQARRIVSLIEKGVKAAAPFFKWMAETAIQDSKLNVRNVSDRLFARYLYFRDSFKAASTDAESLKKDYEAEFQQRQLSIYWGRSVRAAQELGIADPITKFTFPYVRMSQRASWGGLSRWLRAIYR